MNFLMMKFLTIDRLINKIFAFNIYRLQLLMPIVLASSIYIHLSLHSIFLLSGLFLISAGFTHSVINKLMICAIIGLVRGYFYENIPENYTYKRTSFRAQIVDVELKEHGLYVKLQNFKYEPIKGNCNEATIDQYLVDTSPVFPQAGRMRIAKRSSEENSEIVQNSESDINKLANYAISNYAISNTRISKTELSKTGLENTRTSKTQQFQNNTNENKNKLAKETQKNINKILKQQISQNQQAKLAIEDQKKEKQDRSDKKIRRKSKRGNKLDAAQQNIEKKEKSPMENSNNYLKNTKNAYASIKEKSALTNINQDGKKNNIKKLEAATSIKEKSATETPKNNKKNIEQDSEQFITFHNKKSPAVNMKQNIQYGQKNNIESPKASLKKKQSKQKKEFNLAQLQAIEKTLTPGSYIVAIGRFMLETPSPIPYVVHQKLPTGIIDEFYVIANKTTQAKKARKNLPNKDHIRKEHIYKAPNIARNETQANKAHSKHPANKSQIDKAVDTTPDIDLNTNLDTVHNKTHNKTHNTTTPDTTTPIKKNHIIGRDKIQANKERDNLTNEEHIYKALNIACDKTQANSACANLRHEGHGQAPIARKKSTFKTKLRDAYNKHLSPTCASLAKAILLGDTFAINHTERKKFQEAGIGHLLGVSVLNVAIIGVLFYFIIRKLLGLLVPSIGLFIPLNILAQIGAISIIFVYCYLVGFEYPLLRSLLMSSFSLIALYFGKNRNKEVLFWSGATILLANPMAIYDLGFEFSFGAVLGLCCAPKQLSDKLPYLPFKISPIQNKFVTFGLKGMQVFISSVYSTLFASSITIPLALYQLHTTSIQPFLANIVAIPFVTLIITPISLIASIAAFFDIAFLISPFMQLLNLALIVFSNIANFFVPFGINIHVDPIKPYGAFLLILSIVLFSIFTKRAGYVFLTTGIIAFGISIINCDKPPFLLIHPYAIGLVLEDKIVAYPKCNFVTDMWETAYARKCINGKNANIDGTNKHYFIKDKCGKIVVLGKYGLLFQEPKCACNTYTKQNFIVPYGLQMKQLTLIKLNQDSDI